MASMDNAELFRKCWFNQKKEEKKISLFAY